MKTKSEMFVQLNDQLRSAENKLMNAHNNMSSINVDSIDRALNQANDEVANAKEYANDAVSAASDAEGCANQAKDAVEEAESSIQSAAEKLDFIQFKITECNGIIADAMKQIDVMKELLQELAQPESDAQTFRETFMGMFNGLLDQLDLQVVYKDKGQIIKAEFNGREVAPDFIKIKDVDDVHVIHTGSNA